VGLLRDAQDRCSFHLAYRQETAKAAVPLSAPATATWLAVRFRPLLGAVALAQVAWFVHRLATGKLQVMSFADLKQVGALESSLRATLQSSLRGSVTFVAEMAAWHSQVATSEF
jgi:hypothetical protein